MRYRNERHLPSLLRYTLCKFGYGSTFSIEVIASNVRITIKKSNQDLYDLRPQGLDSSPPFVDQ